MNEETVLDLARLSEESRDGTRRLTIDLPIEQHAALRKLSAEFGVPMARFIRELLARWLREQGVMEPHDSRASAPGPRR